MMRPFLIGLVAAALPHLLFAGQSTQDAQADGLALGNSLTTSTSMNSSTLVNSATQQGTTNVWGTEYTGNNQEQLTTYDGGPSLIGIGDKARDDANAGFTGYDNKRAEQASQATVFLDKTPITTPVFSATDPMMSTGAITGSAGSNPSGTVVTCTPIVSTSSGTTETKSCYETYQPYTANCITDTKVTFTYNGHVCTPGEKLGTLSTRAEIYWILSSIAPYVLLDITCAAQDSMKFELRLSADGVHPYNWTAIFGSSDVVVFSVTSNIEPGKTAEPTVIYSSDTLGVGMYYWYWGGWTKYTATYQQICSGGSTCDARMFFDGSTYYGVREAYKASGSVIAPTSIQMNEEQVSTCGPLEALVK